MKEEKDDADSTISVRTSVKLPIGAIAGIVVGIAAFWYAQFEQHKAYDNERFNDLREYVDRKASDRYTKSQASERAKSVEQRFSDMEKKNDLEHKTLQRQIDHQTRENERVR